jgi:hypothetical protein
MDRTLKTYSIYCVMEDRKWVEKILLEIINENSPNLIKKTNL